jgi:hypothetical protein
LLKSNTEFYHGSNNSNKTIPLQVLDEFFFHLTFKGLRKHNNFISKSVQKKQQPIQSFPVFLAGFS